MFSLWLLLWLDLRQVMQRILHSSYFPKCLVHWINSASGLSKVCTVGTTLTLFTHRTSQICNQTTFMIKSVTSYALNYVINSTINHPNQVLCFTTNFSLDQQKVCTQNNLPLQFQHNLYHKSNANSKMNQFGPPNGSPCLQMFPLNRLQNELPLKFGLIPVVTSP